MTKLEADCAWCGKHFWVRKGVGGGDYKPKFCSRRCHYDSVIGSTRPQSEKDKIRDTLKRLVKEGKWHSNAELLKEINKNRSLEHRKKLADAHRGAKSHLWKGGLTDFKMQIRNSLEYKIWRKEVYTRDKYKCVLCGLGGRLAADHIKGFSRILNENNIKTFGDAINCKELWAISNGRTICWPCHRKTENYGWRGRLYPSKTVNSDVIATYPKATV